MTETVEVLGGAGSMELESAQLWFPAEADEVQRMLAQMPPQARGSVRNEALAVLGRCLPPGAGRQRRAGLIVGQVQSGKTASFTAVTALARDNKLPLVILIAGTKKNLLEQSRARLGVDLGLAESDAHRRWMPFRSPTPASQDVALIANQLGEFLDADPDEVHVGVLITVMKNATHMRRLAAVLRQVGEKVDLSAVTALVIDDEVDQATPNLKWKSGSESATYRNLREIREALPRHTLLEYTATPQAPLLVNIADEISPDFTYVLTPGSGYAGGRFFFEDARDQFVRVIPPADLASLDPSHPQPPDSLFHALATFFIGVATGHLSAASDEPAQRSMLVHPSQTTAPQAQFARWIRSARDQWVGLLEDADEVDRQEWIEAFFEPAYADLAETVSNLPPQGLLLKKLPKAMRLSRIEEVNTAAGTASSLVWSEAYSWILIGGAMMDRGFTIEGLTVTYMPRPVGVGNADTVQQRARFFGYKAAYAGFCRAWLSSQVADVFDNYVQHEEQMRKALQIQAGSAQSLKEWRRRILLDPSLRPTRRAVISMLYAHKDWSDSWFQQWHVPLPPASDEEEDIGLRNKVVVDELVAKLGWREYEHHAGVTDMQRHNLAYASVRDVLNLLVDFAMVEDDVTDLAALMLGVEELAEGPAEDVAVFNMSRGSPRNRALIEETTRMKSLFQGRSRDSKYPGDRNIHDDTRLTLQIHWVVPTNDDGTEDGSDPLRSPVPVLAVYVPSELGFGALVEAR